jgi:hypothetical protein
MHGGRDYKAQLEMQWRMTGGLRTFTVIGTRLAELSLWNAAKSPTTRTFRLISSITHLVCSEDTSV